MATKDLMYIYDKQTFVQSTLGEVQQGFEMSFVIDGTKDSAKVIVIGFNETEIQPYTICYHPNTNSWWIIANDKVESFRHEGGFKYRHTLKLLGAVELLNARDLTDCGFFANRYTLADYVRRLFSLSTFEFAHDDSLSYSFTNDETILDMNLKVDYVKTFENYTLLSALRELLDGYNCSLKMTFTTQTTGTGSGAITTLKTANLVIVPKGGKVGTHYNTTFDDSREIKSIDKNSFGTSVISNAENVISTKTKVFPSNGSVQLTGQQYKVEYDASSLKNACLRLPTLAYKVNKITMCGPMSIRLWLSVQGMAETEEIYFDINDITNKSNVRTQIINAIQQAIDDCDSYMTDGDDKDTIINELNNTMELYVESFDQIYQELFNQLTIQLYDGFKYNPVTDVATKDDHPIPTFETVSTGDRILLLADKTTRNGLKIPEVWHTDIEGTPAQCIYWERGSNLIQGWEWWSYVQYGATSYAKQRKGETQIVDILNGINQIQIYIAGNRVDDGVPFDKNIYWYDWYKTTYIVEYIPMGDLKIKYDNNGSTKDSQYYNQNGKLTDGVALSKLLLGYSKEIESPTITKYKNVYKYSDCINVGELVLIYNKPMVCSNVSLTFRQSENDGYYIEGEYTFAPNVATKSLLTNPNTNIRDYGIPQTNNVKRKQVYRDFYELDYNYDIKSSDYYTGHYVIFQDIINLTSTYKPVLEHSVIAKLTYKEEVENELSWYYLLQTSTYQFKKQIYEVVDFLDNNIIGYGSQNMYSGFDISEVFNPNKEDLITTPISYVDNDGQVQGFELCFCNNNQLITIYNAYLNSVGATDMVGSQNYSVFIPEELYTGSPTIYNSNTGSYWFKMFNANDPYYDYEYVNVPAQLQDNGTIKIIADLDGSSVPLITWGADTSGKTTSVEITECVVWERRQISGGVGWNKITPYNAIITNYDADSRIATIVIEGNFTNVNPNNLAISLSLSAKQTEITTYTGAKYNNDFKIIDNNYSKDALEVPVFEYSCQIDDTDNVLVGDNILESYEGDFNYLYPVKFLTKGSCNNNNGDNAFDTTSLVVQTGEGQSQIEPTKPLVNDYQFNNIVATFTHLNEQHDGKTYRTLLIRFYHSWHRYNNGEVILGQPVSKVDFLNYVGSLNDVAIGRYALNINNYMSNNIEERQIRHNLMFVLRNFTENIMWEDGTGNAIIRIFVNSYKE